MPEDRRDALGSALWSRSEWVLVELCVHLVKRARGKDAKGGSRAHTGSADDGIKTSRDALQLAVLPDDDEPHNGLKAGASTLLAEDGHARVGASVQAAESGISGIERDTVN